MERATVTMSFVILMRILTVFPTVQTSIAGETPVFISDQANVPGDPAFEFGLTAWALLEAIEREHLEPPSRLELLKIFTRDLTTLNGGQQFDDTLRELDRCQNAREFAEVTYQRWTDRHQLSDATEESSVKRTKIDELKSGLMEALQEKLGAIRLIRNKDYRINEQFSNNRYVGLGVGLGAKDGLPFFATIMPGGPADRGGITAGTIVHEIDGRSTRDESVESLVDRIRGSVGSEIVLKITSPDDPVDRTVTLQRGVVRFDTVRDKEGTPLARGRICPTEDEPIGWIRFSDITSSTLNELRNADAQARSKRIRILVLDLRVPVRTESHRHASLIADSLIDGGEMWHTSTRDTKPVPLVADRECLFRNVPLVVIVNGQQTGSTCCAIAAALKDAGRATIVGTSPDFDGKIATSIPLIDVPYVLMMNTIKLTRTRIDQSWPLVPDYRIEEPTEQHVRTLEDIRRRSTTASRPRPAIAPFIQVDPTAKVVNNGQTAEMNPVKGNPKGIKSGTQNRNSRDRNTAKVPFAMKSAVPVATEIVEELVLRAAKELLKTVPTETN